MNPTSDHIPQNPEHLAPQQPRRLPGSSERIFTAIVQLFCGFIVVICGLVIVVSKPEIKLDNQERYYIDYEHYRLERFGNTGFGIWGGLVFIATAIPYFFGRNKKSMVGLYFGFCLVSAVIAVGGIGLSVAAINKISYTRSGESCNDADSQLHDENPCCFYKHYYRCDQPYDYFDSYSSSPRDYYSLECELKRELAKDTVDDCRFEARQLYVPQLILYSILLAAVSVELFASLYGASAAMTAFCSCKCCCERQQMLCYTCSSYHSVVNNGCNNFTVSTSEPTTLDTTRIPQTPPPPYVPPQRLLGRPQNTMYEIPNM